MASGKHSKGQHSAPKGSKKGVSIPRGPKVAGPASETGVPEEIAKTAAGKMQTAAAARDETPTGEAATAEVLDSWVQSQASEPDGDAEDSKRSDRRGKVVAVVAAVLVLALACAAEILWNYHPDSTPSQVTQSALTAFKENDPTAFGEVYGADFSETDAWLHDGLAIAAGFDDEAELESKLNDEQRQTLAQVTDKARDFDYRIDSESVDGDSATVQVTVTAYDLGSFAQTVLGGYIADGLSATSKGDLESDADSATRFVRAVSDHLGELGGKGRSEQVSLALARSDDGKWKLQQLDDGELDALTGGLYSTTREMSRQLQAAKAGGSAQ